MCKIDKLVENSEKVRTETFCYKPKPEIESYITHFNSWLLDPKTNHLGLIWRDSIFECSNLAETALFLAVHGFYESANSTLRGILDGFLSRLYWDIKAERDEIVPYEIDGVLTKDYAQWALGLDKSYPKLSSDIWPSILSIEMIESYRGINSLKDDANEILTKLSRFVHGRPESRHYDGAFRGSTLNIYLIPHLFDEWLDYSKAVSDTIFALSLLRYPSLLNSGITQNYKE